MRISSTSTRIGTLRSLSLTRWIVIAVFALLATSQHASAQAATTTTLSITTGGSAVTSVSTGTVVTLTATVTAGSTPVSPGQVKFCDAEATYCEDFHIVGTAQLTSSGTAVLKFRPAIGSHSYKAVFTGTKSNQASTSPASSLSVTGPSQTTTTLSWSGATPNPTLWSNVSSTSPNRGPSGTVSFLDTSNSNAVLGTATLNPSSAVTSWMTSATLSLSANPNQAFAIADFNSDGIPDIAIASYATPGVITVFWGNGDGTFTQAAASTSVFQAFQIYEGDFNGDGIPDLVALVYTATMTEQVTILLGKGDGTFSIGSTYDAPPGWKFSSPGYAGTMPGVADYNHDGIADLAIPIYNYNENGALAVLLGKGDGTFAQASVVTINSIGSTGLTSWLAAGDFNGDGNTDIVVLTSIIGTGGSPTGVANILIGNGDGTFTAATPVTIPPVGLQQAVYGTGILVQDFNNDGIPDLAIDTNDQNNNGTPYGGLVVLLGEGDGTFTQGSAVIANTDLYFVTHILAITAGDFNGDGIPDLAVLNDSSGSMGTEIYVSKGDGTFASSSIWPADPNLITRASDISPSWFQLTAADFTGSGISDLVQFEDDLQVDGSFSGKVVVGQSLPLQDTVSIFPHLAYGTHVIEASYSGDSDFSPSTSGTISIDSQATTTLVLSASPNPVATAGQTTTLTATLNPYSESGASTNGEKVSFYEFSTLLGTGVLSNGVATLTTPALPAGTYNFQANYPGDNYFLTSTSNNLSVGVAPQAQPTLALTASPSSSLQGQSVTLTANLSSYSGTTNGETITFLNNNQAIGTGTLSNGVAVLNISTLSVGYQQLTATYPGDTNNFSAFSNALRYPVNAPATITLPTPGSTLSGSTATFQWTSGTGVSRYLINVGTKWPGADDIYGSGVTAATSATVPGIPTNGVTVYVLLRSEINGVWYDLYYTYTASGSLTPPALTTPAPSSHLTSPTATFQWSPGSGPSAYLLTVGTRWPGSSDIYGTGVTTATSANVSGLPTNGVNVYVQLRYQYNGVWTALNYTYTADGTTAPPVMISPAPGSVLPGPTVTFNWTPGTGVTAYSLFAGTYGPGYFNIGSSPTLTTTSFTLPNIPTNSKPVYVTLRYQINGVWQTTNYTYTAQ